MSLKSSLLTVAAFLFSYTTAIGQVSTKVCATYTPRAQEQNDPGFNLVQELNQLWDPGKAVRVKFLGGSAVLQGKVLKAASEWRLYTGVHFRMVGDGDAEIRVGFVPDGMSWSVVGSRARSIRQTEPTMNFGWLSDNSSDDEIRSVVLHEFGHALGFKHEHQNPQGGIRWNTGQVISDMRRQGWDEAKVKYNIVDTLDRNSHRYSNVDRDSIMMYPIPTTWTTDGFSTGWNTRLSDSDKKYAAEFYSFKGVQGLPQQRVYIKTYSNHFLSPNDGDKSPGAEFDWGYRIHTVRNHGPRADNREVFRLARRPDGKYYILTYNNRYLSPNDGDKSSNAARLLGYRLHTVPVYGPQEDNREAFELVRADGVDKFRIKTYSGHFLSPNDGDKTTGPNADWGYRVHTVERGADREVFSIVRVPDSE